MILSLPIDAWLLLFVAVGLGLAREVAFYRAHRADRRPREPGRMASPPRDDG